MFSIINTQFSKSLYLVSIRDLYLSLVDLEKLNPMKIIIILVNCIIINKIYLKYKSNLS